MYSVNNDRSARWWSVYMTHQGFDGGMKYEDACSDLTLMVHFFPSDIIGFVADIAAVASTDDKADVFLSSSCRGYSWLFWTLSGFDPATSSLLCETFAVNLILEGVVNATVLAFYHTKPHHQ